jgi:hypothetical protein
MRLPCIALIALFGGLGCVTASAQQHPLRPASPAALLAPNVRGKPPQLRQPAARPSQKRGVASVGGPLRSPAGSTPSALRPNRSNR